MDETAVAATTGVAQVFDLHALKAFASDKRVYVLEGTATMSIAGQDVVVPAGAIVKFPANVPHDVRNLGAERCVIMLLKVNPRVLRAGGDGAGT